MARLMIVDDETLTLLALEEIINGLNHDLVGIARSARKAISRCEKLRPDLVIMDIVMPGDRDGIDAAREIRERWNIPSVFLTGHAEKELVERAKKADPLGYIMKPLNETQIRVAIDIALDKRGRERAERKNRQKREKMLKRKKAALNQISQELDATSEFLTDLEDKLNDLAASDQISKEDVITWIKERKPGPDEAYFSNIPTQFIGLTHKEFKIACMIRDGKENPDIADRMGISLDTIKWHRKQIRRKLGLKDRSIDLRAAILTMNTHDD